MISCIYIRLTILYCTLYSVLAYSYYITHKNMWRVTGLWSTEYHSSISCKSYDMNINLLVAYSYSYSYGGADSLPTRHKTARKHSSRQDSIKYWEKLEIGNRNVCCCCVAACTLRWQVHGVDLWCGIVEHFKGSRLLRCSR